MSTAARSCIVTIDNTQNNADLVLLKVSGVQGSFSPSLQAGQPSSSSTTRVSAGTSFSFTLANDNVFYGADALLTWGTGDNYQSILILNIQNAQDQSLYDNVATLSISYGWPVTSSSENLYATSYLEAGVGDAPVVYGRDYAPTTSVTTPLNVQVKVVSNAYAGANPGNFLPNITNVVWLMLENRSLDHVLGQLYTESNPPVAFWPAPGVPGNYDGLGDSPSFSNTLNDGTSQTAYALSSTAQPTAPDPDPPEQFEYVTQQINSPTAGAMGGFLQSYRSNAGILNTGVLTDADAFQIMGFYTSAALPVLSGLAAGYAVSDAWFCSVPSQTYANRAFSVAGTSSGAVDNDDPGTPPGYQMRTLFNVLLDAGNTDWAIYTQDAYWTDSCFLTYQFEAMDTAAVQAQVLQINQFFSAAMKNDLRAFSYIEPAWYGGEIGKKWNGNDYHPTANLLPGEQMLNLIYQALAQTHNWNTTLLIVTFDEHGGNMDHVTPPSCTPPDGQSYAGSPGPSFDFSSLGVRVPALLISPQIPAGTVFRSPTAVAFDHTSVIRTILGWQGIDVSAGVMGARAAAAPDFSGILQFPAVNTEMLNITPRPTSIEALSASADVPLNDLQRALLQGVAHSLCGGKKGSDEHLRVWQDLKALPTIGAFRDYVIKAKAARAAG